MTSVKINIACIYLIFMCSQSSNEIKLFVKCLSTLKKDELKKILVRYYIKVVDLKETGRENDDLISKLDVSQFINRFIY